MQHEIFSGALHHFSSITEQILKISLLKTCRVGEMTGDTVCMTEHSRR